MRFLILFLFTALLTSCGDNRDSVKLGDDKLYFKKPVTEQEAMNTLKWMQSTGHNWGKPVLDFGLEKEGNNFLFQYPVQIKDAEKDPGNIGFIQAFADHLSTDVLNGQTVVVRLTDEKWNKEKGRITSNRKGNLNQ